MSSCIRVICTMSLSGVFGSRGVVVSAVFLGYGAVEACPWLCN